MAEMKESTIMKEWTIMFFFAGDNPLAPYVVHQLKHIKDAGFQKSTDVLVYFDPNEPGIPTKIYEVNRKRKQAQRELARRGANGEGKAKAETISESEIGDGRDSFVRNMRDDLVTPDQIKFHGDVAEKLKQMLLGEIELEADEALDHFLTFCREQHPARHYILFLVGHGMIVGSDAFLPDDNPISAITLEKLREILEVFACEVKKPGKKQGAFDLLALHSCSMSGIEVAYELKGTANFMIASEGPAFIGDWHYRQMLKKSFNVADEGIIPAAGAKKPGEEEIDPKILQLIEDLYFHMFFSGVDFSDAGYSHDLTLCSLDPKKYERLTTLIKNLVFHLKKGILQSSRNNGTPLGKRIRELVQLAHLESQSYWGESYTDLFDFCQCLSEKIDQARDLKRLHTACTDVMKELTPVKQKKPTDKNISERFKALIIHSENLGWEFQYSHGLSIYFPYSKPIETIPVKSDDKKAKATDDEDEQKGVLQRYSEYKFTTEFKDGSKDDSWLSFLEAYFKATERDRRKDSKYFGDRSDDFKNIGLNFISDRHTKTDRVFPQLDHGKINPEVGAGCSCPSIKNFPKDHREEGRMVNGKRKMNLPLFAITKGAFKAFE